MLSQAFNRSTAIRRNSFGYFPTRLFATLLSFPSKVCLYRLSHFKGAVHFAVTHTAEIKALGRAVLGDFVRVVFANPLLHFFPDTDCHLAAVIGFALRN
jgi:hypothetical protein